MKTMYRVVVRTGKIKAIEVIKETPKTVTYKYTQKWNSEEAEHREFKDSIDVKWFYEFECAKAYLVDNLKNKLSSLNLQLEKYQAKYYEVLHMEKPE